MNNCPGRGPGPQSSWPRRARVAAVVTVMAAAPLLTAAGKATITAQEQQDYLRAAACMRSHGLTTFPDPNFSNGTVGFTIPSSIDISSPQFTQARQVCEKLIPAGLPFSRSGG